MFRYLKKMDEKQKAFDRHVATAMSEIDKAKSQFEEQVRKATHNAYAGIVCASCRKNVYRGEGTWVHGNGGKAYCLEPCWHNLTKGGK